MTAAQTCGVSPAWSLSSSRETICLTPKTQRSSAETKTTWPWSVGIPCVRRLHFAPLLARSAPPRTGGCVCVCLAASEDHRVARPPAPELREERTALGRKPCTSPLPSVAKSVWKRRSGRAALVVSLTGCLLRNSFARERLTCAASASCVFGRWLTCCRKSERVFFLGITTAESVQTERQFFPSSWVFPQVPLVRGLGCGLLGFFASDARARPHGTSLGSRSPATPLAAHEVRARRSAVPENGKRFIREIDGPFS